MAYVVDREKCRSGLYPLQRQLAVAQRDYPGTALTGLAVRMIDAAMAYDLARLPGWRPDPRIGAAGYHPDYNKPPFVQLAAGEDYADDPHMPLEPGEHWNMPGTRRANFSSIAYEVGPDDYPLNPYLRTGLRGPGALGRFGPNLAVDNGVLRLRPDRNGVMHAYAVGITRKYDNDAAAIAGGFAKLSKGAGGAYLYDRNAELLSRTEEFFEEMISGSVKLLPAFASQRRPGLSPEKDAAEEAALKLAQVRALDPGFLARLEEVIGKAQLCYAGPVLNASRNTDHSWIETRVSWFLLDDAVWDYIKGADPQHFGYALAAGDDASALVEFRLGPELIDRAFDSHGAFFTYMAASFLLDAQAQGRALAPSVIAQCEEMAQHLEQKIAAVPAAVKPAPGHRPSPR